MKFLVIGLGSMGKRRIRSLLSLGVEKITGFDPREDRCRESEEKYSITTFSEWSEVNQIQSDVWIISTPPDLHIHYALLAASSGAHFFTEASVSTDRLPELLTILDEGKCIGVPSCTMRFFEGPKKIKSLILEGRIGKVLNFTFHWGQYLPTWHPWERYQDFYVGKRETGACREIVPFQFVWLTDVFGMPQSLSCFKAKVSDLDVDIDDIYHLLMKYSNGSLGHLVVDVISKPAIHMIRVTGTLGTIEFDQHKNSFVIYQEKNSTWEEIEIDGGVSESGYIYPERPYIEEMACFLDHIDSKGSYPFSFRDDFAVLSLLKAAEESNASGRHVTIKELDQHEL